MWYLGTTFEVFAGWMWVSGYHLLVPGYHFLRLFEKFKSAEKTCFLSTEMSFLLLEISPRAKTLGAMGFYCGTGVASFKKKLRFRGGNKALPFQKYPASSSFRKMLYGPGNYFQMECPISILLLPHGGLRHRRGSCEERSNLFVISKTGHEGIRCQRSGEDWPGISNSNLRGTCRNAGSFDFRIQGP